MNTQCSIKHERRHTSRETGRAGGKFRLTNRGTDKPCCQVNEYSGTAGSRSLAWWLSQCPLLPGAVRRQIVDLTWHPFFRVPSFIQGWPQNYIASPWTQYSFCVPAPFPLVTVRLILRNKLQLGLALFTVDQ